jgi:hypothetical protein
MHYNKYSHLRLNTSGSSYEPSPLTYFQEDCGCRCKPSWLLSSITPSLTFALFFSEFPHDFANPLNHVNHSSTFILRSSIFNHSWSSSSSSISHWTLRSSISVHPFFHRIRSPSSISHFTKPFVLRSSFSIAQNRVDSNLRTLKQRKFKIVSWDSFQPQTPSLRFVFSLSLL